MRRLTALSTLAMVMAYSTADERAIADPDSGKAVLASPVAPMEDKDPRQVALVYVPQNP